MTTKWMPLVFLAIAGAGWHALAAEDAGLVARWKLDEKAVGTVVDSAGRFHGVNHGAEPGQPGLVGGAYRFRSGENDYVDCGETLQLEDTNQITISALVKPTSFNRLDPGNSANSRNGILGDSQAKLIFALVDRGRLMFTWHTSTKKYENIVTDASDVVPLGVWSHVAVTRDGPAMILYVNGVAKKAESGPASGNFPRFGRLHLGRVNNSIGRDFDGLVSDVRVYRRALSGNEIRQLAAAVGLEGVETPKPATAAYQLERLKFNNPGLVVDLGVGLWAWPLPMDYDGDGDMDLVVSCPDAPYNGTYFFENPGSSKNNGGKMPVFQPGVKIGRGLQNCQASYADGRIRVTSPGFEYADFRKSGFDQPVKLGVAANIHANKVRANQWKFADYDGDGRIDLVIGVGDWTEYGWDNAFNSKGQWTNGPLHGYVYLARNLGTNELPEYDAPWKLEAGGKPMDTFGMPSPNLGDFDGDGDLDLICGDFLDTFTWFENVGTRREPRYAPGRLLARDGQPIKMDLCMITPVAVDWDGDGDLDLIVGQEDGRVAFMEHTGKVVDHMPVFELPKFFQQQADDLKFGVLVNPAGYDWDGDGDEDMVCGNSAGYLGFLENLDGGNPPKWAAPKLLEADGKVIRIQAGPNGSIQGPCEAKWGYTTLSVADWDQDGLADVMINSIWGEVLWYKNVGTRQSPRLAAAQPVEVEWPGAPPKPSWLWWNPKGKQLVTEWRTKPVVIDWNGDGLNDLVMLDHEGYLAWFERANSQGRLVLLPPKRVFHGTNGSVYGGKNVLVDEKPGLLRLNDGVAGKSGRRKFCLADWDLDGKTDLLVDSVSVNFFENVSTKAGRYEFRDMGPVDSRLLAGHDTSPTVVDWDHNGAPDLVVGAEDGCFYYLKSPKAKTTSPIRVVRSEFVYEKAPFPSCHASTIAESPSGLVAAWFGGTREGDNDVGIWVSRQEKGGWSRPVEVANGVWPDGKRYPCWNPVLFQSRGGVLLLFYKVGPNPREWWGMLKQSNDGGRTWSQAVQLPKGILGPIKNKPELLGDGSLLCGSSTEDQGWRLHMERTADLGKTWERTGPLNDGKAIGAIQPAILKHPGGKLQILCRTRQGKIADSWSSDNGRTWTPLELTSLPNPNSGIDAVTLADGRHLLIYNHTPKGRSPLNLAVSKDGKTWTMALVLESEPGEYSYPAIIQAADGLVHVTYTWKRQRIKHAVVEVGRKQP